MSDTPAPDTDLGVIDTAPAPVDSDPGTTDTDPVDTDPVTHDSDLPLRVVVAGDSWSTGLTFPLRDALDASGFGHVSLSWEHTAKAGSTAREWLANAHPPGVDMQPDLTKPRMLDALHASLDAQPPAAALVLVLGGNDLHREAGDGLGKKSSSNKAKVLDAIRDDLVGVVQAARAGRPHLEVVLVGYSYFHFDVLKAFGLKLDGFDLNAYNQALIDLETRKATLGLHTPGVHYAHNLGLLQHVWGDTVNVPWPIPNPFAGYPEYAPGVAPRPGDVSTAYHPFPGGFQTYPVPLAAMPDGIHPSPDGFRDVADHLLDQGFASLLEGGGWVPR